MATGEAVPASSTSRSSPDGFTPRDLEIVSLLAVGREMRDISNQLGITENTVKQHLRMLYLRHEIREGNKEVRLVIHFLNSPIAPPPEPVYRTIADWNLTPRESQIVEKITQGLTSQQIGDELGTSEQTVKNWFCSIFEKAGCENRAQLVAQVINERRFKQSTVQ